MTNKDESQVSISYGTNNLQVYSDIGYLVTDRLDDFKEEMNKEIESFNKDIDTLKKRLKSGAQSREAIRNNMKSLKSTQNKNYQTLVKALQENELYHKYYDKQLKKLAHNSYNFLKISYVMCSLIALLILTIFVYLVITNIISYNGIKSLTLIIVYTAPSIIDIFAWIKFHKNSKQIETNLKSILMTLK